jgi:hypothetical protein
MDVQLIHRLVQSDGNTHVVFEPGDIYTTTDADGELLIAQGSAVAVEAPKEEPKRSTKKVI